MMLKELVGNAHLTIPAIVSLLIFLGVFVAVVMRSIRTSGDETRQHALDAIADDIPVSQSPVRSGQSTSSKS